MRFESLTYEQFLETIPDAAIVVDQAGKIVLANSLAYVLFGYQPGELLGQSVEVLVPEAKRELHAQHMATYFTTPKTRPMSRKQPLSARRREGSEFSADIMLRPIKNDRGVFVTCIVRDMTERVQAAQALQQRLAELEALHAISSAMRQVQSRDEVLPILLDKTLAALETDSGSISLYDPDSNTLRVVVARGWFRGLGKDATEPGIGIAGTVFATGKAHCSPEFARDMLTRLQPGVTLPLGWGGACLPIPSGAETVGVLFVSVRLPRHLAPEQIRLIEAVAEMSGVTLHRMRLHEDTVRRLERLQSLQAVDRAITSSLDARLTFDILLQQVIIQLQVDAAGVLLFNPQAHMLEYGAGRGFHTQVYESSRLRLGEGLAGQAALERRLIHVTNLLESPAFVRASLLKDEGFAAYVVVPFLAKGQLKGVLEVFRRQPFQPNGEWLNFLEILAGQAAIAIDNLQLFDGLQRSNQELALAYDTTLEGWSHALDLRDKETEGHTQRVTEMTLRLASAAGMTEDELVHVRRGALLHDIGKMGVPDAILLKPGNLTDEEWTAMRRHPTLAYDLLSPIAYLRPALDIPLCHHEKWDGSGYPRGLKGEQIPLSARLFAVVDVWDALRSDRPYRQGWPEEKVLDHIRAQSGTHFDPKAVQLFLRVLSEPTP